MAEKIAPFANKPSANKKKLASTTLVQLARNSEPTKSSHSSDFKYSAVTHYAHYKGWSSEKFNREIDKKGGLSRLVKLYGESLKGLPKSPTRGGGKAKVFKKTISEKEVKSGGKNQKSKVAVIKDLAIYKTKAATKKLRKTVNKQPKSEVGKFFIAQVLSGGYKLIEEISNQK